MTKAELDQTWTERDHRYSMSRRGPDERMIQAVRDWRTMEAFRCNDPAMIARAIDWTPPPFIASR